MILRLLFRVLDVWFSFTDIGILSWGNTFRS